jgi:hypothetical protein
MLQQSTLLQLHFVHSTLLAWLNVHTSQIPKCCCESNRATDKLQLITYYLWIVLDTVTKMFHINFVEHEICTARVLIFYPMRNVKTSTF